MVSIKRLIERLRGAEPPAPVLPSLPLDLLDPAFLRDPYPTYQLLRETDPVHRMRTGAFLLTGHGDIVQALSNPALGNAPSPRSVLATRHRERHVSADVAGNILPFLDSPEHTAPRKIIAGAFRAHLRDAPPDVAAMARALLEPAIAAGGMEVMAEFGKPLSVGVVASLFGLPDGAREDLLRCSHAFFYLFAPMQSAEVRQAANDGLAAFRSFFQPIVAEKRRNPDSGLVSRLIQGEANGRRLDDGQIVDACMLLFADGVENVDAAIANTLLALSRHPDQRGRLYETPDLVKQAVGEALRFDPPAQSIARVAREDLELGGKRIGRDGVVFLSLAAGNRDPAVFSAPDQFDLSRDTSALLTFGRGRHACVGAALVRMQVEAAVRSVVEARLVADADEGALEWSPRIGHRWLTKLDVRFRRL